MNNSPNDDWKALFDDLPIDANVNTERQQEIRRQAMGRLDTGWTTPSSQHRGLRKIGQILMKYKVPHCTAASIAVAALVWFTQIGATPVMALELLVESILDARTAQYDMIMTVRGQPPVKLRAYHLDPGHFRQELPGGTINIADWQAGKMVGLDPANKRATVFNLVNLPDDAKDKMPSDQFAALRDALRTAIDDPDVKVERLGNKTFSGVETTGYRFKSASLPMTIWADPESRFPVRIEFAMPGPPVTDIVMENYQFDVKLDESLFSVEIPADYKVIESDVDASPVTETDFIESLKLCNAANDGRFPARLDPMSISQHIATWVAKEGVSADGEPNAEQINKVIEIGRGLQFVTTHLPKDSDAHYAGAGVRDSDADRPVFWYRPDGSASYRVIYADYSVKDADQPPQITGAVKVE